MLIMLSKRRVLSKKVEIVWLDHTDHTQLLPSCNRECSDIFNYSTVWIFHSEGNTQIEQFASKLIDRDLPSLEL